MKAPEALGPLLAKARGATRARSSARRLLASANAELRLAAMLLEIDETMLPRALTFQIGAETRIVIEARGRLAVQLSGFAPDTLADGAVREALAAPGKKPEEELALFAGVLKAFAEASGELAVLSEPSRLPASFIETGQTPEDLAAACGVSAKAQGKARAFASTASPKASPAAEVPEPVLPMKSVSEKPAKEAAAIPKKPAGLEASKDAAPEPATAKPEPAPPASAPAMSAAAPKPGNKVSVASRLAELAAPRRDSAPADAPPAPTPAGEAAAAPTPQAPLPARKQTPSTPPQPDAPRTIRPSRIKSARAKFVDLLENDSALRNLQDKGFPDGEGGILADTTGAIRRRHGADTPDLAAALLPAICEQLAMNAPFMDAAIPGRKLILMGESGGEGLVLCIGIEGDELLIAPTTPDNLTNVAARWTSPFGERKG
jgi:hypothetical protein